MCLTAAPTGLSGQSSAQHNRRCLEPGNQVAGQHPQLLRNVVGGQRRLPQSRSGQCHQKGGTLNHHRPNRHIAAITQHAAQVAPAQSRPQLLPQPGGQTLGGGTVNAASGTLLLPPLGQQWLHWCLGILNIPLLSWQGACPAARLIPCLAAAAAAFSTRAAALQAARGHRCNGQQAGGSVHQCGN